MIKKIDERGVWVGTHMRYTDKGKLNPKASTHVFDVEDRKSGILLGQIKWMPTWRKYTMWVVNCILGPAEMRELADTCELFTNDYRSDKNASV